MYTDTYIYIYVYTHILLEFEQFVSDPTPQTQIFVDANMGPVGDMLAILNQVGFGVRRIVEQTCKCMFGSRCMWPRHNKVSVHELSIDSLCLFVIVESLLEVAKLLAAYLHLHSADCQFGPKANQKNLFISFYGSGATLC